MRSSKDDWAHSSPIIYTRVKFRCLRAALLQKLLLVISGRHAHRTQLFVAGHFIWSSRYLPFATLFRKRSFFLCVLFDIISPCVAFNSCMTERSLDSYHYNICWNFYSPELLWPLRINITLVLIYLIECKLCAASCGKL